jgi:hypothetical protein
LDINTKQLIAAVFAVVDKPERVFADTTLALGGGPCWCKTPFAQKGPKGKPAYIHGGLCTRLRALDRAAGRFKSEVTP